MKKRPFLLFIGIISAWVAAAIWFIQSPHFAVAFKRLAARYVPGDLGVTADFSEFAVRFFPPGVSIKQPSIVLREHNVLKLPAGTSVRAERIDLNFQLFQMFSGDIRIHEAVISKGEVNLILSPSTQKKASLKLADLDFHWDELFQVRAEAIAAVDTRLHVVWRELPGKSDKGDTRVDFLARSLRLSQWSGKGGLGYEAKVDLAQVQVETPEIRAAIAKGKTAASLRFDEVKAFSRINRVGAVLDELLVKTDGWEARASGKIKGDLLNSREKKSFEAELRAEGALERLERGALPAAGHSGGARPAPKFGGQALFTGKVRGSLGENWLAQLDRGAEKIMESVRAEGRLEIKAPHYEKWSADHLSMDGSWVGAADGGELSITKGWVRAAESERVLAASAPRRLGKGADGGEIEIGAFKLNLSAPGPVTVPLTLKHAHIHWLAAPALHNLFPLLFRASGPVRLTYFPAAKDSPWQVQAKMRELNIVDFQLDNQKLESPRPLHRVLKFPKLSVNGEVLVDSAAVKANGLTVAIDRSRFKVEGTVDYRAGYDLRATGQAHLSEIGQLAESAIGGEGSLTVHVHGPASRLFLDFDADLQNAFYLNMHFGSLKGRITWDDDPSRLVLSGIQARKGQTSYFADGAVDLGKNEKISILVRVPEGDIQDLGEVFADMTKGFWWFPRTLSGAVSGDVTVSGGVGMKELQVAARLNGRSWDYLQERLDQVTLAGGYDKGRYYIGDFKASKRNGRISGRISFDAQQVFDWDFHTQQLSISDLDHLARLDVPMRGRLAVDSSGNGKLGAIQSNTRVSVSEMFIGGRGVLPSRLDLKTSGGRMDLQGSAFEGQGILEASYDFTAGGESYLRAEMKQLDFTSVLLLLNPRAIHDPAISGKCSGSASLAFRSGEGERARGLIELKEYSLSKTGASFHLIQPVAFKVNDGSFDLKELTLAGNRGRASLSLRGHQGGLQGMIAGSLDVSLAEFFTSSISQATGVAQLDFAIGGSLREPSLLGQGSVDGVSFRVPSVESPFENMTGSFSIRQNTVFLQNFQADLAGGRVLGEGAVTVFADRYPTLALTGTLTGNKVKVFPFQFVKVRGNLKVHGDRLPYKVDGAVFVDSALSKENMLQKKSGPVLTAVRFTPPPSPRRMGDYPKFKLNIDIKADGGILVQNDLFDAELKAQVKAVNTLDAPRLLGTVDLVQGKMIFKDRKFQIQSASAVFDNPTVINPRFNLTATTDVSWVKVQLYASGRTSGAGGFQQGPTGNQSPERLKIELNSTPVMPESEIISLLALGMTANETKKLNPNERAVFEQGEAASLLLHSLDFNREVESKTGLQIQLDESVNIQQTTSVSRPQAGTEMGAAPKIVIKKQLTKNLDVSYGSTLGVGTSTQKQVNAEIKVTPGFSVLGVWDSYESTVDTKDKQTSYGMDLKVQKRFK